MTETTHRPPVAGAEEGPIGRFLRATELDPRLIGMVGALLLIWVGFHALRRAVPGRRHVPDAAQPLEPQRPDGLDRHHGDGHGARHHHPQHRPVGRLDRRCDRHVHGPAAGRMAAAVSWPWPSGDLDHHGDLRHHAGRADRRASGLPDRLSDASRPSSSRWAACWSGAASPSWRPTGAPSRRWIRPSR